MLLTSSVIISQIQSYAGLSINQLGLSNDEILRYATLEMEWVCSQIISQNEQFLTHYESIDVEANQARFRIPPRSLNGGITHLNWQEPGGVRRPIARGELEDTDVIWQTGVQSWPARFLLVGDFCDFLMPPTQAGSVNVWYPFMPNNLVIESEAPSIIDVDYEANSVEVGSAPAAFISGVQYDIIDNRSGNQIVYYDLDGSVAGNVISFTQPIPHVLIGNYIGLRKTSPIPMVPEVMQKYIVEMTAARIAFKRGAPEQAKLGAAIIQDLNARVPYMLAKRVNTKPKSLGGRGRYGYGAGW